MFGALALLLVLGVVGAVLPWRVPQGALRAEAETRLRLALGAPDATFGPMTMVLLPTPRLRVTSVSFAPPGGRLAGEIDLLKVLLRVSPLVRGIAKPAAIELVRPRLALQMPELGADAIADGQALVQLTMRYLAAQGRLGGISEVAMSNGRLAVATQDQPILLNGLKFAASLPARTKPLKLSGQVEHNGDLIRFSFSGGAPNALASGAAEPILASAESERWAGEFTGTGSLSRGISLKGTVLARYAAMTRLPYSTALDRLGLTPVGASVIRAALESGPSGTTLSNLIITSGAHRFEGVAALRRESQRWQVNATLATPRVDLTAIGTQLNGAYQPARGWDRSTLQLDALMGANIDLRLSADRLLVGPHTVTQAALALITRSGRIEASLGEGGFNGGKIRGRVIAGRSVDGYDVRMTGALDNVDIGETLAALGVARRITGRGNAETTIETTGASIAGLVAQADGRISVTVRNGQLIGVDLARLAARRGVARDIALAEALGGTTSFENLTLSSRLSRGLLAPVEGAMQADRLVGTLSGEADLPRADVNLTGAVVRIPTEAGESEPRPIVDFTVTGPLLEPRITPNIAVLLKRS